MRARFLLPMVLVALAGCDRLKGGVDQKALDAEAIGYSCRISLKVPEDCIKENDAYSPTSILYGWKEADRDIKEKAIDPTMGKSQPVVQPSTPPAAEGKPPATPESKSAAEKAAEGTATGKAEKPAGGEKPVAAKGEKPAAAKEGKSPAETAKPGKAAAEKPAAL